MHLLALDWMAPMAPNGAQMGIEVRTKGPGPHSLHDRAQEVLAETFNRIFALCLKLHSAPSASTLDLESVMERTELHARLQGLVMQFSEMLRYFDPLIPSCQVPTWTEGAGRLFGLIFHNWSFNLRPLDPAENTDETWGVFFAAVEAAEQENHQKAFDLIDSLKRLTPRSNKIWDWHWRVYYYAQSVAPEYRRWFTGIEGDVALPRI